MKGDLFSGATAASAEAEAQRVREAAGELRVAAEEVQSLFQAAAARFDGAVWRGASARLAEGQVVELRGRVQRAAAELDGVAWAMLLRAGRLEDTAQQLRAEAALTAGALLDDGGSGSSWGP